MAEGIPWRAASVVLLLGMSFFGLLADSPPAAATSPPTVTVVTPNGGESLSGGSLHTIAWRVDHGMDTSASAALWLSLDGGATFPYFLTWDTFAADGAYPWTVPAVNTDLARIRACAYAWDGSTGCGESIGNFRISFQGSTISLVSPANRAYNVPRGTDVVFSLVGLENGTENVTIAPSVPATTSRTSDAGNEYLVISPTNPLGRCTLYGLMGTARDLGGGPIGPLTWQFTSGCTSPIVLSTEPAHKATRVPMTAVLSVRFDVPMDPATFGWTVDPWIDLSGSWYDSDTELQLAPPNTFSACTEFSVSVWGSSRQGEDLRAGPVPNPWNFTTTCEEPYLIYVAPADGAVDVPLDSDIVARFSEAMDTQTVAWTVDPAENFTAIWNTPVSFSDTVTLQLLNVTRSSWTNVHQDPSPSGFGQIGHCAVRPPDSLPFSADSGTASAVVTLSLVDPFDFDLSVWRDANANGVCDYGVDVFVGWSSATLGTDVVTVVNPPPGAYLAQIFPYAAANGSRYHLDIDLGDRVPLSPCTDYRATIPAGEDRDGNPLVPGPVPNPWSFSTDCAVDLLSPMGGERWTGRSVHPILWTVDLPPPPPGVWNWTLSFSQDGGASWSPIASGSGGNGTQSFDWTVPSIDTTTARVRVCIGDPGLGQCDTSDDFAIDSTSPTIRSSSPADGATGVPITTPIDVLFSEGMNRTTTESAFWILPDTPVLGFAWPAPDGVSIQLEPFRPGTLYTWGFGCGATDASDPGNVLADCQTSYRFLTEPDTTSVSLVSPVGGESWTGGSPHDVAFRIRNGGAASEGFVASASFRYAGGTQGGLIGIRTFLVPAGGSVGGAIPWTVPLIDALDVIVNVTAVSPNATVSTESGGFEIDSAPPSVLAVSPAGFEVSLDPVVVVNFSEPMGTGGPAPPTLTILPSVPAPIAWNPTRDALAAPLSGTLPCTDYTVTLAGFRDDSDPGNSLPPYSWSFRTVCLPSVDLLAPNGGEDWTGGSLHTISWSTADGNDPTLTLSLAYSLDGGADGFPYTILGGSVVSTGAGSYPWTVPRVDSEDVLVRIEVVDAAGHSATDRSAAVFTIDSTPPRLLVSFPGDGSSGHKTTRELWFVWSEPVHRPSFAAGFRLTPDPGGVAMSWSVSNLGGDVALVDHNPLKTRTRYVAEFASGRDDSDPGNPIAGPVTVTFTTQPPPPVNPPVALAVGQRQVEAGTPATFDGTGSTGDIRDYVWGVMDNQDRFVAVLLGPRPTYTFSENGRYAVVLTVTDVNGNSDDDTIEIVVTSNPHSSGIIVGSGALLAVALIASTETGRYGAMQLLLAPMYARLKRDELLEQETRGMIRGYILVHPGDSYSDIKRNLRLSNGTLSYHLTVLEREGIIRSQTKGSRRLFYPREGRLPEDGGGMHEVQLRMFRAVVAIPGLSVTDLAGALGISSQLALYHLRDLAGKGWIRFDRRGLRLRCYPERTEAPPREASPEDEDLK